MSDIVTKLRQTYSLEGTQPEHPVRRAVEEILRLREEAERMRLLAVEARQAADAYRRELAALRAALGGGDDA